MNSQQNAQSTRNSKSLFRHWLRESLLGAGPITDHSLGRLDVLKSTLACSTLALAAGGFALGFALVAPANAQLQLGTEVEAPADPVPLPALGDDAQSWDLDEEFEEVEGVTPLLRGPMHEAYAERFSDDDEDPLIVSKEPPEPIDEQPPEVAPEGSNFVWIPGYWGWEIAEEDFVWVSGVWRKVPPKHQWVPGYWAETEGGWQWISGFWTTAAEESIVYLPPPPESLDVGPSSPAPGDNYFWIPGCWNFTSGNYAWRAGYWGTAQNDWVWMPNRYVWTPSGYIFRRGYWDYRLPNRGIVFAPVHFHSGFHGVYRPTYTIQVNPLLLANMFIAPGCPQYYYGNYHGYHGRRQMYSWSSYYRHGYDPFLSYYAHQRRHEKWLHDLNRLRHHIAVTPHLQSQVRVADQFKHRHDFLRQPHSIDTLLRVSSAKRLVSSSHPSFKPSVPLKIDRDIHDRFPRDQVVDPMRDFARKRRELERAQSDVDRDRAKRPAHDSNRGRGPGNPPRDSIELKELKLGGRDEFRGRPGIPRDLQIDRKTERVAPVDRSKIPSVDREKARETRKREWDRVLGTKENEKLTPEQLRDVRRELLGTPPSPGTTPTDRSRPDRNQTDRNRPDRTRPARPSIERPSIERPSIERPSIERPSIERPSIERPSIERPSIERPSIERPSIERPRGSREGAPRRTPSRGTIQPEELLDRIRNPQSDLRTRERIERPQAPRLPSSDAIRDRIRTTPPSSIGRPSPSNPSSVTPSPSPSSAPRARPERRQRPESSGAAPARSRGSERRGAERSGSERSGGERRAETRGSD